MRIGIVAVALCLGLLISGPALAVDKGEAKFIGATFESSIEDGSEHPINLKNQERLVYANGELEIPWTSMEDVEYGQKAGHRIGTAILLSPVALFKKARHHYVTVAFKSPEGSDQAVVLEFDKGDIRMALATFRARTGKDITYQDEEARKQMGGGEEESEK